MRASLNNHIFTDTGWLGRMETCSLLCTATISQAQRQRVGWTKCKCGFKRQSGDSRIYQSTTELFKAAITSLNVKRTEKHSIWESQRVTPGKTCRTWLDKLTSLNCCTAWTSNCISSISPGENWVTPWALSLWQPPQWKLKGEILWVQKVLSFRALVGGLWWWGQDAPHIWDLVGPRDCCFFICFSLTDILKELKCSKQPGQALPWFFFLFRGRVLLISHLSSPKPTQEKKHPCSF